MSRQITLPWLPAAKTKPETPPPPRTHLDDALVTDLSIALREMNGSLALSANGVYQWFQQADQAWSFTSAQSREALIENAGLVWAGLLEDTHDRVLARPYPAHEWAVQHATNHPTPAKPDVFDRITDRAQQYIKTTTLSDTETYSGLRIGDRSIVDRLAAAARGKGKALDKELAEFTENRAILEQKLTAAGINATPVDGPTLAWLVDRSIGLGLPQRLIAHDGDPMSQDDMASFYDDVRHIWHPGKQYVEVVGAPSRNGKEVRRFVSIVALGKGEDLDIPGKHKPWIAHAESLPFPVEWSIRHRTLTDDEAAGRAGRAIDMIADQVGQYQKHGLRQPPELRRVDQRAEEIRDEARNAHELDSKRVDVYARAAVVGRTPEEALHNARALAEHYRKLFKVHRKIGQRGLYREFWPCEPLSTTSHRRTMRVRYFAGGVPNLSTGIGHRDGILVGHTATIARRTFTWNLFAGMERRKKSGFVPIIAEPGEGKSSLIAGVVYTNVVAGEEATILDLSGPLAELCYMPEIRDVSRHVDLSQTEDGRLSPYGVIGDPRREQFYEHPSVRTAAREGAADHVIEKMVSHRHGEAQRRTESMRQQLAETILTQILPVSMRQDPEVQTLISDAVGAVPGLSTSTLNEVVAALPQPGQKGATVKAGQVRKQWDKMRGYPQTRLFFGPFPLEGEERPRLVVITAAGITLPDERRREEDWSEEERLSVPLMTMAAYYASRRIYDKPMRKRHLFAGDEVHKFRRFAAGKTFWDHLARDSRKWNTKCLAGTQKPQEMRDLEVDGLIDEMFLGRVEDEAVAKDALELMAIRDTRAAAKTVATLSERAEGQDLPYREFIVKMGGKVELVRVDWRYLPELRHVIDAGTALVDETPVITARLSLIKDDDRWVAA